VKNIFFNVDAQRLAAGYHKGHKGREEERVGLLYYFCSENEGCSK
jgi:hypothetical protein